MNSSVDVPSVFLGFVIGSALWLFICLAARHDSFEGGVRQGQLDASNGKWHWHLKDNEWQPVDPPATRPTE